MHNLRFSESGGAGRCSVFASHHFLVSQEGTVFLVCTQMQPSGIKLLVVHAGSACRCARLLRSYVGAFFESTGGWEPAFERFLRAPPSGSKDRAAMRDVAAFLATGVDSMCPRGFQALANAAEVRPERFL